MKRAAPVLIAGVLVLEMLGIGAGGPGSVEAQPPELEGQSVAADCYLEARHNVNMATDQLIRLCTGATTARGPVSCLISARKRLYITDAQAVQLCHCAESTEPVDCYRELKTRAALVDDQIATMCSPTIAYQLLPNCRPIGGDTGGY